MEEFSQVVESFVVDKKDFEVDLMGDGEPLEVLKDEGDVIEEL